MILQRIIYYNIILFNVHSLFNFNRINIILNIEILTKGNTMPFPLWDR